MFSHPLIHALIAAADQKQFLIADQLARDGLRKTAALGGKKKNPLVRPTQRPDRFRGIEDRFWLQHHAFAAAERAVIHRSMEVMRPVPEIVNRKLECASLRRA